jgi:hypothetical protein
MRPAIPPTRNAADPFRMLRREQAEASSLLSFIISSSHTEYAGRLNIPSDLKKLDDGLDTFGFSLQGVIVRYSSIFLL